MNFLWKNLNIEHVEQSSGVFTGTNVQSKWISIKKTNQGFGQPASSTFINTKTYIDDHDLYDLYHNVSPAPYHNQFSPSTDSDTKQQTEPISLKWQELHIGALNQQSILSVGENHQSYWSAFHKANLGLGVFTGKNITKAAITFIDDQDFMDHTEFKVDNRSS